MKTITLMIILSIVTPFIFADSYSEIDTLLQHYNDAVQNTVSSDIFIKHISPIRNYEGYFTWSVDLSFGSSRYPYFELNDTASYDFLAPPDQVFNETGCSFLLPNISFMCTLPGNFIASLSFSYFPSENTVNKEIIKAGGRIYYSIIPDSFHIIGIMAGLGYSYVTGLGDMAVDYTHSSGFHTQGAISTDYSYHVPSFDIVLHKTFYLSNFYTRVQGSWTIGSITSSFAGETTIDTDVLMEKTSHDYGFNLIIGAGFELNLGFIKLNCEGGRDFLSGTLCGNAGIRIEL